MGSATRGHGRLRTRHEVIVRNAGGFGRTFSRLSAMPVAQLLHRSGSGRQPR